MYSIPHLKRKSEILISIFFQNRDFANGLKMTKINSHGLERNFTDDLVPMGFLRDPYFSPFLKKGHFRWAMEYLFSKIALNR